MSGSDPPPIGASTSQSNRCETMGSARGSERKKSSAASAPESGSGRLLVGFADKSSRARRNPFIRALPLLGNRRVGDELCVTEHRQRRRQIQLFSSADPYLIGKAFQRFDRDRRRRYPVDQDLLGFMCRELPDAVVPADQ